MVDHLQKPERVTQLWTIGPMSDANLMQVVHQFFHFLFLFTYLFWLDGFKLIHGLTFSETNFLKHSWEDCF